MIYWPVYNRFGGGLAFFYVFNGQHCLAYLGLLFHMTSNKTRSHREFESIAEGTAGFAKFYTPLAFGAIALSIPVVASFMARSELVNVDAAFKALQVLDGIFVTHYYIESNTWNFSNSHNRAFILPLLRNASPGVSQQDPSDAASFGSGITGASPCFRP